MVSSLKKYKTCKLIYLIGNKIDNYIDEQVSSDKATEFAEKENLRFFGISCKTDGGIKEFFDDLVHNLIKI